MLDEYKQIYATAADRIPNWKKLNKNELCFKYIENENKKNEEENKKYDEASMKSDISKLTGSIPSFKIPTLPKAPKL